jgi:predicted 3-demethylubiquinone-9 3-methyltransferase (glyoxalase superfamily)
MPKIVPCLWFDSNAEEAVGFYASIFKRSRIGRIARYGEAGQDIHGRQAGTVMTIDFELDGHPFTALNGGPVFTFNEAVSFQVQCRSQREIDYYWSRLGRGGDPKARQCGWLKDKFGVSWQIVPARLPEMLRDADAARSERVMKALLKMKKLDIRRLKQAYERP